MPDKKNSKLQEVTDAGVPDWVSDKPIPTSFSKDTAPASLGRSVAHVDAGRKEILVSSPNNYTPASAAHEATHVFQNTRNYAFQKRIEELLPRTTKLSDYDYGGIKGLMKNSLKSIGDYNPEQQAKMVEDLTRAQTALTPHMTQKQLEDWDTYKNTLERLVNQLKRVPAQDTSLAGKIDRGLGMTSAPLERAKDYVSGMISPPKINTTPLPAQNAAPSAALGYANLSKLVSNKAADYKALSEMGHPQYRYYVTSAKGRKIGSNDGKSWVDVETGAKASAVHISDLATPHPEKETLDYLLRELDDFSMSSKNP